jgi:hypothetical protein|tara:strand:- start:62 stop:568 length:507 start_codon:yes stop_codon:yes gene_type:complete
MRKMLLLLSGIYLAGCAETLPPMAPSSVPMKKANAIIIRTDQSPEEAYKGFANHLTDNGMMLKRSDPILMIMNTEVKDLPVIYMGKYAIQASVREDTDGTFIKMRGFLFTQAYKTTALGMLTLTEDYSDTDPVMNIKGLTSPHQKSWEEMIEIASVYPHNTGILYSRE